jgi:hypothetical protein
MLTSLRPRSVYDVVALVGLFVALGGTAVAAGALDGPAQGKNSVGSLDIIDGQVQSPDIQDSSVGGSKVKNGAIASADILDGSITGDDIANGSVTQFDLHNGAGVCAVKSYGGLPVSNCTHYLGQDLENAHPSPGIYCIDRPTSAPLTGGAVSINLSAPGWPVAFVSDDYEQINSRCPGGTSLYDAVVATYNRSEGVLTDEPWYGFFY